MRILATGAVLALSACGPMRGEGGAAREAGPPAKPSTGEADASAVDARLAPLADCDALRGKLTEQWTEAVLAARYGTGGGYGWGWEETDTATDVDYDAGGAERGYSTTTTQEPDVDEPDVIKTDGTFLYATPPDRSLAVMRAWPPEQTAMVSRVDLRADGASILLDGTGLLAIGTVADAWPAWDPDSAWRGTGATRLRWVDVADAAHPTTTRVLDVEGWPIATRAVGGAAWVVLSVPMVPPPAVWELVWADDLPPPGSVDAVARARTLLTPRIRAILDALPDEALLPRSAQRAPTETDTAPLLQCADLWAPADGAAAGMPGMVAVVRVPVTTAGAPTEIIASGLLASANAAYVTPGALTVAEGSWPIPFDAVADTPPRPQTRLHRFTLADSAAYAGSACVDGMLLTPWALDEHEGHLRVATADLERGTNLFVLGVAPKNGILPPVGALRGVAPGETMRAVRYDGDRAWLITFEQVDPLFTLDLSEPRDPRIAGELVIPGFSAYLHPFDGDRLLGVGMAGTLDGRLTGVDVSLFDIADPAVPKQMDELVIAESGWSESEILWDPHAFTFFDGVAAIPVQAYTEVWDTGGRDVAPVPFSGLVVVDVDRVGTLTELGRVDHSDLVDPSMGATLPLMRRSVVIEDVLYSMSDAGVKASVLRDPSVEIARVPFVGR